jgi:replication factor A1
MITEIIKRVIDSLRAHIHAYTYTKILKNCFVQSACRTEVGVRDMSDEEPSESKELMKVEKLTPNSREVNIVVKVVSKSEVRNVTGRDYSVHRVADALVGDETGSVVLTLWDDNIDKINEEATIRVTNGYVNLFRGNMRLNIGRYGSYQILEEKPIKEVNTENNLSEKRYEQERRYRQYRRPRYGERRDYQRRRY